MAQNARMFAAVAQAMDDAMISVFEAKYQYNFWRPATAIRNGDIDGNDATQREASWTPLVDAPMHPEYPSAHSILAGAVAHGAESRGRHAAHSGADDDEPDRQRRDTHAGRASTTSRVKSPIHVSMQAFTTGLRPTSVSRWASRSAS